MKKIVFVTLLMLLLATSFAQQDTSRQAITGEGYWVIESNIKTPRESIVYFYSADHLLMYKEKISGKKLNLSKRKTVKCLNAALQECILTWQKEKLLKENGQLVANKF